jgi:hypothetical protein
VNLDANALFASFVVGSIGFVAFIYGKRQGRAPQLLVGLTLMVFPYFVSNVLAMGAIAAGLLGLLWLAVRFGW